MAQTHQCPSPVPPDNYQLCFLQLSQTLLDGNRINTPTATPNRIPMLLITYSFYSLLNIQVQQQAEEDSWFYLVHKHCFYLVHKHTVFGGTCQVISLSVISNWWSAKLWFHHDLFLFLVKLQITGWTLTLLIFLWNPDSGLSQSQCSSMKPVELSETYKMLLTGSCWKRAGLQKVSSHQSVESIYTIINHPRCYQALLFLQEDDSVVMSDEL